MDDRIFKTIQKRAYETSQLREFGRVRGIELSGNQLTDWLEAEEEIRQNPELVDIYEKEQ